jgi:hypothetical protein
LECGSAAPAFPLRRRWATSAHRLSSPASG